MRNVWHPEDSDRLGISHMPPARATVKQTTGFYSTIQSYLLTMRLCPVLTSIIFLYNDFLSHKSCQALKTMKLLQNTKEFMSIL